MGEIHAQDKFACPACGAEATWNPAKKALVCAFCGTTSPANLELTEGGGQLIVEHDLMQALRSIPDEARGFGTAKTEVKCQSCQAISIFDPERVAQTCDFCGSASLVPYHEIKEPFRPESMLEFKLSANDVRDAVKQWLGQRWFAPKALKSRALTDTVKGIYIPYWTFDAQADAQWTAMSGYYYYVTESYTDSSGKRQTRQVRKTRWEPSAGRLEHFFDDTLVPASKGVHGELLRKIEPFPNKDLKPYHAGYVAGWVVERYQIDLGTAATAARDRMQSELERLCAGQVPGDTHMNLAVRAQYSAQTFKHILAPIWLLKYDYHGKPFQVLINGSTGTIAGEYPKSWLKITLALIAGAIVVYLLLYSHYAE